MEQKENEILIPFDRELKPGLNSVEYFGSLYHQLKNAGEQTVVCDLRNYRYIHPSFAVLIATSVIVAKMLGKTAVIRYSRQNAEAVSFLTRTGLISAKTAGQDTTLNDSNLPLRRFWKEEETIDTIRRILDRAPVRLDDQLSVVLISRITEVFSNAFTHGHSEIGVFICGLFDEDSQFTFSVYDAGVGIPHNVTRYLGKELSPSDALEWAFCQGNSTLNGTLDYPRGAGLNLLESFVKANGGRIDLVSRGGYCRIDSARRDFYDLSLPFIGTMFSMTIRADNNHIYKLA